MTKALRNTANVAQRQRELQREADAKETKSPKKMNKAMQAGARKYPEPPFPPQHQSKPGHQNKIKPQPLDDAPYYKGSDKLKDKVAIITGGDSGIGRAIAVLFAREGADIAIIYLQEREDANETKRAVETEGRKCLGISGDVGDREFCKTAVDHIARELGSIDILVNNAAFQEHQTKFEDLSEDQLEMTVRTNLFGYFNMAQAVTPHMKAGSAIINCGSVTGIRGSKELLDYSATKGAIHALTRSLASHLIPRGIRVNAVAPGPVWSPLNPADRSADEVRKFGADTPMKRPAQPEEISPAFVFFASPQCSSYITGEILPVIGGY